MTHERRRSIGTRPVAIVTTLVTLLTTMALATVPAGSAPRSRALDRGRATHQRPLDAGATARPVGVSARTAAARTSLARSLGTEGVIQSDPTTGSLRFVGRLDGYLTQASSRSAASIAFGYMRANRTAFGLRNADLQTLHLQRDYVDIAGTHHLSWVQRVGHLTVFGQGLQAAVTSEGRLVNVTGSPVRGLRVPATIAGVDAARAIDLARASASAIGTRDARDTAERTLFPTGRGVRRAWRTITYVSPSETDLSVVDAVTGEVLYRTNMTDAGAAPPQTGSTGDDIWQVYFSSIPPNLGGVPADDVELGAVYDTFANFFGLPGTYPDTQLFGNNAWVFKDVKDDSFPQPGDAIQPTGGTAGGTFTFDYPVDGFVDTTTPRQNCSAERACTWDFTVAKSWKAQLRHNATQVYSFLNRFHDHLEAAPIGFNDAAGNFEFEGSSGPDGVLANASDGANTDGGFPDLNHVDNANMSTPPDGSPPTMQMYLFKRLNRFGLPTLPSANGGDDAEVVYHEYTHGLSNRLVLYPDGTSGLDAQQSASMGEAWSDWYATDFLNDEGFKPDDAIPDGDLIMGEFTFNGVLRSQGVDCAPDDDADGACPGGFDTGPGGYTYGDFGKVDDGPEVHADGEIWLETLWDLRSALDSNGAADGGSAASEELVTRAMELSPPSPTYLDMRNAILQADEVANGGANQATIWQVFADRGMGYYASALNGSDVDPIEDRSLPPDCDTDPCHTVSGTVTDKVTDAPIEDVVVSVAGLGSGLGFSLADRTGADGTYSIADVPDHDAYGAFTFVGPGYEFKARVDVAVAGDRTIDQRLFRDWAALGGGAVLKSFTDPDYAEFCSTNANGAFDTNLGSGWPSDSVDNASSGVGGPRRAVVRLPEVVNVKAFAVASGGACGDGPAAAVKHFQIQTRRSKDAPWKVAIDAKAKADGVLRAFHPTGAAKKVQSIRFVMLSNHGDPDYMDVVEVSVRGTAI